MTWSERSRCSRTSDQIDLWDHRVADLGDGFDPYQESITWEHGRYVATGRMGKFPAVSWTSSDLRRWEAHTIAAPSAVAYIAATPRGFIAYGATSRITRDIQKMKSWPALWHSDDGQHWQQTLKLPATPSGRFTAIGRAGRILVAVGTSGPSPTPTGDPHATSFAYLSTDGQTWTADPRAPFPVGTSIEGSGTLQHHFAVVTGKQGPSTIWTASLTP
jgi:hypothetical protein